MSNVWLAHTPSAYLPLEDTLQVLLLTVTIILVQVYPDEIGYELSASVGQYCRQDVVILTKVYCCGLYLDKL